MATVGTSKKWHLPAYFAMNSSKVGTGYSCCEGAFGALFLAAALNLLFLVRGEWDSIGEYMTTLKALRIIIGEELLWARP